MVRNWTDVRADAWATGLLDARRIDVLATGMRTAARVYQLAEMGREDSDTGTFRLPEQQEEP